MVRSSLTATEATLRTSNASATAATGRFSGSSTSNSTSAVLGSSAPRHRRGRKALIGVSGSRLAESGDDRPVRGQGCRLSTRRAWTAGCRRRSVPPTATRPSIEMRIFAAWPELAQQADLVQRHRFLDRAALGDGMHAQRMQHGGQGRAEAFRQVVLGRTRSSGSRRKPQFMPNTGMSRFCISCSVASRKPSPPSATITCASCLGQSP